eukprot:4097048-Amphidinium_carterae.1
MVCWPGANVGPSEFDKAQGLMKEHPRIALQDKNGATLLHWAIQYDSAPEIVRTHDAAACQMHNPD